jgi:hypothetical protein
MDGNTAMKSSQRAASVRRDAEKDVGVQEQAGCVGQAAAA